MCCHKKPTKLTIPLQFLHVVLRCWRHQFCPWSHDKQEQWCDTPRETFLAHLPKKQKECLHKQELFEEPGVQKQADSSLSFNNAPSLCISSMLFSCFFDAQLWRSSTPLEHLLFALVVEASSMDHALHQACCCMGAH